MDWIDPKSENDRLIRRGHVSEKKEINEEERSLVAYASTKSVDSYQEVLLPDGWVFDRFAKNPVMPWSHNYRLPPVGRAMWWKTDSVGLLFKAQFGTTAMAEEVWSLYRDGMLNAFSVGYEQLASVTDQDQEEYTRLLEEYQIDGRPKLIGTKQHLWEISPVVLPANADALVTGMRDGRIQSKAMFDTIELLISDEEFCSEIGHTKDLLFEIIESRKQPETVAIPVVDAGSHGEPPDDGYFEEWGELEERGATPFRDLPTAPENTPWDGSKARQNVAKWASSDGSGSKDKINWAKYRRAFFWHDAEDAENFRAYKLPFADVISGELRAVWRGVSASMAALLGGRGGVDIPQADRRAVYNHIAKYYKKFDKEAPDFREPLPPELAWLEAELDEIKDVLVVLMQRLDGTPDQAPETENETPEISFEEAKAYIEKRLPELIEGEIRRLRGKVD